MKIQEKIYFHELEKIKEIIHVKEIYCIPVFGEGLSKKEVDEISMDNFIFPGKKNWDWYFSENNGSRYTEKIENVYFSKRKMNKKKYDFLDYFPDVDVLLYTEK